MKGQTEENIRKVVSPILTFIFSIIPSVIINSIEAILEWYEYLYFFLFRRPGDLTKRKSCCDNRPEGYAEGIWLEQIPELKDHLVRAGFTGNRSRVHYYCSTCGQHWILFLTGYGMGDVIPKLNKQQS